MKSSLKKGTIKINFRKTINKLLFLLIFILKERGMDMDLLPIAFLIDGLSIYKNLRNDKVISNLHNSVVKLNTCQSAEGQLQAISSYTAMCSTLYESEYQGSLSDYIFDLVLYDINIFSKASAEHRLDSLSPQILQAASNDLHALFKISHITSEMFKANFQEQCKGCSFLEESLPDYTIEQHRYPVRDDWGKQVNAISDFYAANGVGMYAKYKAFIFEMGRGIQPVITLDPIRLTDLKKYEVQRNKVLENTLAFIEGHPYNNVLLYGDRGTGKSSTVKAILNEYKNRNLRMIEISKRSIADLDKLINSIQNIPLKFIIFIDDLTFNENDDNFGILKAILDGSLSVRPDNVAIYATTNRRHLIKETFSAREGNEVHRGDTMDESLSLSDRFGLTVTFMKPNKDDFLTIVRQLAADRHIEMEDEKLCAGAERFALANSGRTPRLARQYIDHIEARIKLNLEI